MSADADRDKDTGFSPAVRLATVAILRPLLASLMRRDWRDSDNVPRDGGLIVAANHLSEADPLVLSHFIYKSGRYPAFLAKSSLFGVRGLGWILRKAGQIPVYRDRSDAGLALRAAERALRAGECLMFYPEGTCTRDPDLWPMTGKTGAARLALTTGAPVVPVAHWGAQEMLPYGTKRFRPFPRKIMHVAAGPPVDLSKYAGRPLDNETLNAATADIMRAVAVLLGELRGATPPDTPYDHRTAVRSGHTKPAKPSKPAKASEPSKAPEPSKPGKTIKAGEPTGPAESGPAESGSGSKPADPNEEAKAT